MPHLSQSRSSSTEAEGVIRPYARCASWDTSKIQPSIFRKNRIVTRPSLAPASQGCLGRGRAVRQIRLAADDTHSKCRGALVVINCMQLYTVISVYCSCTVFRRITISIGHCSISWVTVAHSGVIKVLGSSYSSNRTAVQLYSCICLYCIGYCTAVMRHDSCVSVVYVVTPAD